MWFLIKPIQTTVNESTTSIFFRSLVAKYEKSTKYDGIPVWLYTASLGDMSKNAEEKCYCPSNDTCLKKGLMDLFKCGGFPIYVSLPHFYDSDESYLSRVEGLQPSKDLHGIEIYFEHVSMSNIVQFIIFIQIHFPKQHMRTYRLI